MTKALPEKITGPQTRNTHFMIREGLLLHSPEPATCSYRGPDKSSLFLPTPLLDDPF
jgi:hypothetical protein